METSAFWLVTKEKANISHGFFPFPGMKDLQTSNGILITQIQIYFKPFSTEMTNTSHIRYPSERHKDLSFADMQEEVQWEGTIFLVTLSTENFIYVKARYHISARWSMPPLQDCIFFNRLYCWGLS